MKETKLIEEIEAVVATVLPTIEADLGALRAVLNNYIRQGYKVLAFGSDYLAAELADLFVHSTVEELKGEAEPVVVLNLSKNLDATKKVLASNLKVDHYHLINPNPDINIEYIR